MALERPFHPLSGLCFGEIANWTTRLTEWDIATADTLEKLEQLLPWHAPLKRVEQKGSVHKGWGADLLELTDILKTKARLITLEHGQDMTMMQHIIYQACRGEPLNLTSNRQTSNKQQKPINHRL